MTKCAYYPDCDYCGDTALEYTRMEFDSVKTALDSVVEILRDIAAIKGTSKRQKVNSEIAANWLQAHGYALEPGGYIPGVGFEEES